MIFKVVLTALTAAAMFYFLVLKRHSALPRVFLVLFFGTGLGFILWPEITNRLAAFVGIGRGADLILYTSTLFFFFVCFNFFIRFKELEEHIGLLARELALQRPVREGDPPGEASEDRRPGSTRSGLDRPA